MEKILAGADLSYNVFRIPLPTTSWNEEQEEATPEETRRILSHFHFTRTVALCLPTSNGAGDVGAKLLRHKVHSARLKNADISKLCSAQFIRQFLIPHKLHVMSTDGGLSDGFRFSLTYDDGLHLQVSKRQYNVLGLSNTNFMNRHHDDYITLRMDVTSGVYLKDDSKLYHRTIKALERLSPCDCIAASNCELDHKSLELYLRDLGHQKGTVLPLAPTFSTNKVVGDEDSTLLSQEQVVGIVNGILSKGRITIACQSATPVPLTSEGGTPKAQDAGEKRRKVLSSEETDTSLDGDLQLLLQHKESLFKAYRTLSQEKNKTLDKLNNLMKELYASKIHKNPAETLVERLRHTIDDIVFRGMTSSTPSVWTPKPSKKGLGFVVTSSTGSYITADSLFEVFKSCCNKLSKEMPLFILCAMSLRSPRQNALQKHLGMAPIEHHLYIICCRHLEGSEASVIVLTST